MGKLEFQQMFSHESSRRSLVECWAETFYTKLVAEGGTDSILWRFAENRVST